MVTLGSPLVIFPKKIIVVNLKGRTILHFCEQNFGNINSTKTHLLGEKTHTKSGNHHGVSVAAE